MCPGVLWKLKIMGPLAVYENGFYVVQNPLVFVGVALAVDARWNVAYNLPSRS